MDSFFAVEDNNSTTKKLVKEPCKKMNSQPQPPMTRNSIAIKPKSPLTIQDSHRSHDDDEGWIAEWLQNGTLATE